MSLIVDLTLALLPLLPVLPPGSPLRWALPLGAVLVSHLLRGRWAR